MARRCAVVAASGMIGGMHAKSRHSDTEACASDLADALGPDLRIAAPLGLGKPHGLLNALYRLTAADPTRSMRLYTALSLTRPQPKPGLEQRFLQPFLDRHFGTDAVDPQYTLDQARDALPPNVAVHEFYLQSGALLHSGSAQRSYISQNYTHVARDLVVQDINLLVQLVARREGPDGVHYSLSCNPDLTLDFLRQVQLAGAPRPLCVAVVHPDLPWLGGDAEVAADYFDVELRPEASPRLFALPRLPVDLTEYAIGLHASALVRDGGCLQVGIGALSDALVKALLLRQHENTAWRCMLVALDPVGSVEAGSVRRQRNGDGRLHAPAARRHPQASQLEQPGAGARLGLRAAESGHAGWSLSARRVLPGFAAAVRVAGQHRGGRPRRDRHVRGVQRQPALWRSPGARHTAATRRAFLQHLHDGDPARRRRVRHAG